MYEVVAIHDHMRWQKILDLFQVTDIYYTSQYFLSAMKLDPGESMMFYYNDEEGEVVYPFIKRRIENDAPGYFDITTPFGYGGPLLKTKNNASKLTANFLHEFSAFCEKEKIIAEFIRFHPLKNNALIFEKQLKLLPMYETFAIKLDLQDQQPKEQEDKDERSNGENGVVIKKLGTVRHMFEFLVLYYSTVRRREDADSYYFFTNDYFETLISSLGPNLHLFGAYCENKLVSACYVLTMGDTIYHHLDGSLEEAEDSNAMKALLLKIAEWGKENSFTFFHLGSDFKGEGRNISGLKKGIANQEPSTFYICEKVHDTSIYKKLISIEEIDVIKRYRNV
ncbi:GNAT family N-acetyltransferase [Planococcus shenhongbingii]|uniref:GNAT family N-acetyltransferase n=1 Tax=Planococcus shenhongbingii TaxID=3058398 RepID=A0ABT8N998_9BACL|nr:GNAT family N-acetyltransferase [Planococcus sp. N017]MDN7244465.1 GNAT family N-acetyltransferase [Planococcus sp. N017]